MSIADNTNDVTQVRAETTARAGRFIVSAGIKHFVSDTRASAGGPGEAVGAGELLLSALASCALGLIQGYGTIGGFDIGPIGIEASFKRDAADPTRYEYIRLVAIFADTVTPAQSDAAINNFTSRCPIYNTLRRGGDISIVRG